jgi:sugar/nucleoside kinase (ribokinase family)
MPTYCFRRADGSVVTRFYHMRDEIPRRIVCDDGEEAVRDLKAEHDGPHASPGCWPMTSIALGVHPAQVGDAVAEAKRKGVPTEFLPDGRPILRDRAHRRAYMKALGYFDRDAGYSD